MMHKQRTWTMCVLLVLAYLCAQSEAQEIYYTGKLFGYYRIEHGEKEKDYLAPVRALVISRFGSQGLLLGMGDNFGPEFGAGIQLATSSDHHCSTPVKPDPKVKAPETLYKQESRYALSAECDNVMNFLMLAGYRAIVPGREDFIYSASWLIRMAAEARLAAGNSLIANPEGRLDFLAANLRLTNSADLPKGSTPTCPLMFAALQITSDETPCTTDSSNPAPVDFDWLERLDKARTEDTRQAIISAMQVENAGKGKFRPDSDTVSAMAVKNEFSIMKAAWRKCNLKDIDKNATTAPRELKDPPCSSSQLSRDEKNDLSAYWTDFKNRLIAVFGTAGPVRDRACQELRIRCPATHHYEDLLISPDDAELAQKQFLRNIKEELSKDGYTIAGAPGQRVLIVGVVGKETMSAISQANLRVCLDSAGPVQCPSNTPKDARNVTVFDPVSAVIAAIRAARSYDEPFTRVIVMAQMPAPEAEVLASRVRYRLKMLPGIPPVDAVIAEAQSDYQTGKLTLEHVQSDMTTPIFTPPAPDSEDHMFGDVAHLSIASTTYKNDIALPAPTPTDLRQLTEQNQEITTTSEARRLMRMQNSQVDRVTPCPVAPPTASSQGSVAAADSCRYATMLAIMSSLQRASKADLVLLERRDIWTGGIYTGYGGGQYDREYCPSLAGNELQHCLLRVALDRFLWKGDYLERVAVTGADLVKILTTSAARISGVNDLRVTDLSQQWLVTYGVTQSPLTNLTRLSGGGDPQWIPGDPECKRTDQTDTAKIIYCVDGRPIASDQIYWVATSDDLAEDKNIYTQLGALDPQNRSLSRDFQTEASAIALEEIRGKGQPYPSNQKEIEGVNAAFQQQPLFQVDYNKLILSFNSNRALGPTDKIPGGLQGVADSRAAVPHSQDVDMEASLRLISNHAYFMSAAIGTQTSTVYERSIKGNLSGSPESISYPQNNASFGAFLQYTLSRDPHTRSRALPRELLVFTPHQFQTQVNNPRLFLGYSSKDASGNPIAPGQLAVALPLVNSFSDKAGYRHEWGIRKNGTWSPIQMDAGSYAEAGFEYSLQNNVLQSVTLTDPAGQPVTCSPTVDRDIATCFKNSGLIIDSSTKVVGQPATKSLHTPGGYWDIHLSRGLDMGVLKNLKTPLTLISDSQGDWFSGRPASAELPTQTRYAVTWSSSLNVPVWGNLSFGPTYNVFFYQPQLSAVHEQIRTFSVALRWYLARDQRVPLLWKAPQLSGPASADQTKNSGKSK